MVLRIIFELERFEVKGRCRKVHSEGIVSALRSSINIIRVIKGRRMR
jgi:hypothetical protein